MKKIFSIFAVFLSLSLLGCQKGDSSSTDTIKIGAIGPLTGDAASYGLMLQRAGNLRIDEINEKGGVNGKNLELVWEDGKCTPSEGSRAAQKLIGIDKVSIIFGGGCSGETLGAAPITEKKQVILFSGLSSSPEVTDAGDFVFRSVPSDSSQGKVIAEYANEHFPKIGILSEQTDYAMGVANVFESHYTGEVVRENFLSHDSDFKTRITKLKNEDIQALFINPQTTPGTRME